MTRLRLSFLLPLLMLMLLAMFLGNAEIAEGLGDPIRLGLPIVIGLLGIFVAYSTTDSLAGVVDQLERVSRGGSLGSKPSGDGVDARVWEATERLQQRESAGRGDLEARRGRLEQLRKGLDRLASGSPLQRSLDFADESADDDALAQCAASVNQLDGLLASLDARATQLARGEVDLKSMDLAALQSKSLSDVDLPLDKSVGLGRNVLELNNQLRRLTIQARIVASDQLESPLLNERLPGELGDAFATMVENLRNLSERAREIADGDLTSYSGGDGELNTAFNVMVSGLREVVQEIIQTAMRISTSAEEILAVLRDQELSASHQASGVEETQRTMETLLSSAKKIAESAQTVFKSAERTQANNRIISDRASELKSHTERIGEILESIKEIADRSDLLALNASLEGLRAGEAGKGFTLVANEMRRLAENIKGSVGDIKELLSDIRESALSSVLAIEEGTRLSERTTDSALKITLITQQQQSGTEQVTQSMEELSHLINQGLAGTRQVTMAASELAGLSDDMRQLVDAFQLEGAPMAPSARARGRAQGASTRGAATTMSTLHRAASLAASPTIDARRTPRAGGLRVGAIEEPPASARTPKKSETARKTMQINRPSLTNDELNATMRFVGYGDEDAMLSQFPLTSSGGDDSPTVDVSQLELAGDQGSYDEVDGLFDELDKSQPGGIGRDTINEKIDAIERDLEDEGDDPA